MNLLHEGVLKNFYHADEKSGKAFEMAAKYRASIGKFLIQIGVILVSAVGIVSQSEIHQITNKHFITFAIISMGLFLVSIILGFIELYLNFTHYKKMTERLALIRNIWGEIIDPTNEKYDTAKMKENAILKELNDMPTFVYLQLQAIFLFVSLLLILCALLIF